jgi:[protein-PII] uridylyltransferase
VEPQLRTLLLAALLHDIGKGTREDHCVRGETLATRALERMGVESETAADVAWLVRNHLLLSETATKRNIGDEVLVLELTDRVGTLQRLRMLFLLTIADALATGPAAWSAWKATLVSRLHTRIEHQLADGRQANGSSADQAQIRLSELRAALRGYPGLELHLSGMPRVWLLSESLDEKVEQSRLMLEFSPADKLKLYPHRRSEDGIWELTVVALDRTGLLSKVAGALALHGLKVLGAEAYTRNDGIALGLFRLEALGEEEQRFEAVSADVLKALGGRMSLDMRLAEKRLERPAKASKSRRARPRVMVDNEASDFYTVVEVHAVERLGMLYTMTRALAELELDIHLAKVSTYGDDVVNVFYLTDPEGRKVTDPEYVTELEKAIFHRLDSLK